MADRDAKPGDWNGDGRDGAGTGGDGAGPVPEDDLEPETKMVVGKELFWSASGLYHVPLVAFYTLGVYNFLLAAGFAFSGGTRLSSGFSALGGLAWVVAAFGRYVADLGLLRHDLETE